MNTCAAQVGQRRIDASWPVATAMSRRCSARGSNAPWCLQNGQRIRTREAPTGVDWVTSIFTSDIVSGGGQRPRPSRYAAGKPPSHELAYRRHRPRLGCCARRKRTRHRSAPRPEVIGHLGDLRDRGGAARGELRNRKSRRRAKTEAPSRSDTAGSRPPRRHDLSNSHRERPIRRRGGGKRRVRHGREGSRIAPSGPSFFSRRGRTTAHTRTADGRRTSSMADG
jgi:hypothetical protein